MAQDGGRGGGAALTTAIFLGLLRQVMWATESITEVFFVTLAACLIVLVLLVMPFTRRLLPALWSGSALAGKAAGAGVQEVGGGAGAQGGKRRVVQVVWPPPEVQQGVAAPAVRAANGGRAVEVACCSPAPAAAGGGRTAPEIVDVSDDPVHNPGGDGRAVRIVDQGHCFHYINTSDALTWPSDELKRLAGSSAWQGWTPATGTTGTVCHYWNSNHAGGAPADTARCSFAQVDLVVVRTAIPAAQAAPGSGTERFFVASAAALEPADGGNDPLQFPRDGDSHGKPTRAGRAGKTTKVGKGAKASKASKGGWGMA